MSPRFPQKAIDLAREQEARTFRGVKTGYVPPITTKAKQNRQPTKTEMDAWALLEKTGRYSRIVWEGISLRLRNGHRYLPDLVCIPKKLLLRGMEVPQSILLVEVKNAAYKLPSYGRSKLAYDQAKLDWPEYEYAFMVKGKDGTWRTE